MNHGLQRYKDVSSKSKTAKKVAGKDSAKEASKENSVPEAVMKTTATKEAVRETSKKKAGALPVSAKKAVATAIENKTVTENLDITEAAMGGALEDAPKVDETVLQAEIAEEVAKDAVVTAKLVNVDCSPANTPRERLIVEYAPLIKFIAQKIAARLPANVELDDLISSGVIGLMDAVEKYDSSRDNKFKTYAEFRIRGAILDELRAQDWVPRSVREKAKQLERAYTRIEQQKGRQATDEEICAELNVSQLEFHDLLNEVRGISLLSFDDLANLSKADKRSLHTYSEANAKSTTPFGEVSLAHMKKVIADAIQDLPEKQRLVLSLYYYEDLNLKEIGRVLDVTESRVSQLHTQAVLKLKARLRTNWDELTAFFG